MTEAPQPENRPRPWWSRPWAVIVWLAAFLAAAIAALNGVPQFVDETLPWLGERINLGPVDPTIWDIGAFIAALLAGIASALASGIAYLMQRRVNRATQRLSDRSARQQERERMLRHTMAAVGGTTVTCSCGWRGEGWRFKAHREGRRGPEGED